MSMRILIAPDKFKGSLTAAESGEIIAAVLQEALPNAEIVVMPLGDGGEGTAEILCKAMGGVWRTCRAHDPLGREIEARYAWIDRGKLAVMEMSEIAGQRRLRAGEANPGLASTFGVGEMLLDAAGAGATEIVVGLGGSATNDGGYGLARSLGFQFLGINGVLGPRVTELRGLREIVQTGSAVSALRRVKIVAASDVANPLLGTEGATRIFGPQKGLAPDQIEIFEQSLARLADVAARHFGADRREEPGAGAAGGLGYGLTMFATARLCPGFDLVAEKTGLPQAVAKSDVVITGEGSLDAQTGRGKTPGGVARLARERGKRIYAIVGRTEGDPGVNALFDDVFVASSSGMATEDAISQAPLLLRRAARELGAMLAGSGRLRTKVD